MRPLHHRHLLRLRAQRTVSTGRATLCLATSSEPSQIQEQAWKGLSLNSSISSSEDSPSRSPPVTSAKGSMLRRPRSLSSSQVSAAVNLPQQNDASEGLLRRSSHQCIKSSRARHELGRCTAGL